MRNGQPDSPDGGGCEEPRSPRERSTVTSYTVSADPSIGPKVVCASLLFVGFATCFAGEDWDAQMDAAAEAYEQGRYAEAEKLFLAAVGEAESFGPQDVRAESVQH